MYVLQLAFRQPAQTVTALPVTSPQPGLSYPGRQRQLPLPVTCICATPPRLSPRPWRQLASAVDASRHLRRRRRQRHRKWRIVVSLPPISSSVRRPPIWTGRHRAVARPAVRRPLSRDLRRNHSIRNCCRSALSSRWRIYGTSLTRSGPKWLSPRPAGEHSRDERYYV